MSQTPTPLPSRLDGVQILRGVAATAVAWHHALETSQGIGYAAPPPNWLVLLGAAGVDVFFVISGFIMVFICARRGDAAQRGASLHFLVNRARRIYPLYWVCCAAFLGAMALGFLGQKRLGASDIFASLLLWPSDARIVGISWTLSYEVYFYLVFAACLMARNLRLAVYASSAVIAGMIVLGRISLGQDAFLSSPITLEFVFGMMVGLAFSRGRLQVTAGMAQAAAIAALIGFVAASIFFYSGTTHRLPDSVRFLAWGVPSILLLVAGLGAREAAGYSVVRQVFVGIGDASYAVYLFHPIVLIIYAKAFEVLPALVTLSQWVWVPVATMACIVAGWICHVLIEKPIMAQFATRTRRRPAVA